VPGELVRLIPQGLPLARGARSPALGQVGQIGKRDGQPGLAQDGEDARARPQHQRRPAIGAIEGGSFVAGRFVKLLFVRFHVIEGIERRELVIPDRKLTQRRRAAVGSPPLGQAHVAVMDLARFEFGFGPPAPA
jgi:hypothetical protein